MPLLIMGGVLLLALVLGPQIWVRRVMHRHGEAHPEIPGTGAALARHLLDQLQLYQVEVRPGPIDSYDPARRQVTLSEAVHDGRSITALAVAAHEVGHAIQHRDGWRPLEAWANAARFQYWTGRIAAAALMIAPLAGTLAHAPAVGFAVAGLAGLAVLAGVLVQLLALPVELDASWGKALPILEGGGYLPPDTLPAARQVLRAAAFTYVASALWNALLAWRWMGRVR